MGFEISWTDQVQLNAVGAERVFNVACRRATQQMADVPKGQHGYDDMWLLYFYLNQRDENSEPDLALEETINHYAEKLESIQERGGMPWELAFDDEQAVASEQELKTVRKRGRMLLKAFEWLSPTSRGKKSKELGD